MSLIGLGKFARDFVICIVAGCLPALLIVAIPAMLREPREPQWRVIDEQFSAGPPERLCLTIEAPGRAFFVRCSAEGDNFETLTPIDKHGNPVGETTRVAADQKP